VRLIVLARHPIKELQGSFGIVGDTVLQHKKCAHAPSLVVQRIAGQRNGTHTQPNMMQARFWKGNQNACGGDGLSRRFCSRKSCCPHRRPTCRRPLPAQETACVRPPSSRFPGMGVGDPTHSLSRPARALLAIASAAQFDRASAEALLPDNLRQAVRA